MSGSAVDELRALLRAQTDMIFQGMRNLSEAQTKDLSRALNIALQAQTDAVVAALNSYVIRIFNLEREVAALREGRTGEERTLQ